MEVFGWTIASILTVFFVYSLFILGRDVFGHGVYERHQEQKMRNMRQKSGYKHLDK